jgi:hypothetical protein
MEVGMPCGVSAALVSHVVRGQPVEFARCQSCKAAGGQEA